MESSSAFSDKALKKLVFKAERCHRITGEAAAS
jgi:hypothetical protein